jgi:hypothetical protein
VELARPDADARGREGQPGAKREADRSLARSGPGVAGALSLQRKAGNRAVAREVARRRAARATLQRIRADGSGDSADGNIKATAIVEVNGLAGWQPKRLPVLFNSGETLATLRSWLANNYPMTYATTVTGTRKPFKQPEQTVLATAPLASQLGTQLQKDVVYKITLDVPLAATQALALYPGASTAPPEQQMRYIKLYESGQWQGAAKLAAQLPPAPTLQIKQPADPTRAMGDPWILPADIEHTLNDVNNVIEIAERPDLTPMLEVGDVYVSTTITGAETWPDVVRYRYRATGSAHADSFTIFTGTHGNVGGQKLNPSGTHWDPEAGTKANAPEFPKSDQEKADRLEQALNGVSIKVIDVWDKSGALSNQRTTARAPSSNPDNLLVEPAKLQAAVRSELAAGRVVILAWCFSLEAFKIARFAGAPTPASERSGAPPGVLPSETDYVAARKAVPMKTIVTELFPGGPAAWRRSGGWWKAALVGGAAVAGLVGAAAWWLSK